MTAPLYILEGAWDTPLEASQILPYFLAYEGSHKEVKVYHRTIRSAADIAYYVSKIPMKSRSFVYFACHGEPGFLDPSDGRSKISYDSVLESLGMAKKDSISFLHFGSCEFLQTENRKQYLSRLANAAGSMWTSGYAKDVDWLASTLLDLALVSEVYVPWHEAPSRKARAEKAALDFHSAYSQLSRSLGFSALSSLRGASTLFPPRVRGA